MNTSCLSVAIQLFFLNLEKKSQVTKSPHTNLVGFSREWSMMGKEKLINLY